MSRFSNSLAAALKAMRLTQAQFSRDCGISPTQLNKYLRDAIAVGSGNIQSIARALPERERAEVVTAWLRDQVPEVAAGLVNVLSNATEFTGELSSRSDPLAPKLQLAIEYLTAQARKHTEISDLLIDLARALRGDHH